MVNAMRDQKPLDSTTIQDEHFPALYQSANQASRTAQRRYLCCQWFHIACLILGSFGAALATIVPGVSSRWIYIVLAIILVIGVILNLVSRVRRYDRIWFDCRAIAESTKTAAWRYMMKATPFKDDSNANQAFITQLQRIRDARPSSSKDLAQSFNENAQVITGIMGQIREKPLDERRNLYQSARISDQKNWYSENSRFNAGKEDCWFVVVTILQVLAVVLAIIWAASESLPVNIVPVLMTCAASAIAWSKMKRYGELAQSYSLAAQELGDQEAIFSNVTTEDDLLTLVEQVEETISREHTMWCARREVV